MFLSEQVTDFLHQIIISEFILSIKLISIAGPSWTLHLASYISLLTPCILHLKSSIFKHIHSKGNFPKENIPFPKFLYSSKMSAALLNGWITSFFVLCILFYFIIFYFILCYLFYFISFYFIDFFYWSKFYFFISFYFMSFFLLEGARGVPAVVVQA